MDEMDDKRLEAGDWRPEAGDRRLETGGWRPEAGDWRNKRQGGGWMGWTKKGLRLEA